MKNIIKKFGIAAMVAIIGFSMAALSLTGCDTGSGSDTGSSGDGGNPTSREYSGGDYKLVITRGQGARATVFTPQNNDTYVLTINSTGQTSTGTITVSGTVFTLTPLVAGAPTFTIIISDGEIESVRGTITLDDETSVTLKTIKITGITLSIGNTSDKDTNGEGSVFIYSNDDNDSLPTARGDSLINTNGELLIDLYECDGGYGGTDKRWTGNGEYFIHLMFAPYSGDRNHDTYYWWTNGDKDKVKYNIQEQNAVTTLEFSEFGKD